MEEQIKTATDQAQTVFAAAGERAKSAAEKGTRLFEEMSELNKGHVEAVMESGRIAARGLEAFGRDASAYAKRSYENSVAAARTLAAVKTPAEFMQVQGDLIRQSFDALVSESSRSAEQTLKLAGEIVQPLQNRWALAADKVRSAA
ncbi:phasin family protein [Sphingomonas gellani]|uniref:Phasin family protein n=1 Tax=Sphingomonas gellani TaxID=1166340 RepID=A0A1H8CC98_9SPHN|nr:phasin family protein [Sphingomonas gellani]SEM92054.1 phasin family protein [Sphingomonas gellani]